MPQNPITFNGIVTNPANNPANCAILTNPKTIAVSSALGVAAFFFRKALPTFAKSALHFVHLA